ALQSARDDREEYWLACMFEQQLLRTDRRTPHKSGPQDRPGCRTRNSSGACADQNSVTGRTRLARSTQRILSAASSAKRAHERYRRSAANFRSTILSGLPSKVPAVFLSVPFSTSSIAATNSR